MVKGDELNMDELEKELEAALENIEDEVKGEVEEAEEEVEEVEKIKDKKKDDIVNDADNASEAVIDGFGNINQMIYERLDINRACLMILFVLVLILIFKEDIMKSSFVKNLLK